MSKKKKKPKVIEDCRATGGILPLNTYKLSREGYLTLAIIVIGVVMYFALKTI